MSRHVFVAVLAAAVGAALGVSAVVLLARDEPVYQSGTSVPGLVVAFTSKMYSEDQHDDEVRTADIDGTETTLVGDAAHPSWSPDGTRVAFERRVETRDGEREQDEIYVANVDGSGERRLTFHATDDHDAAWSPDGSSILFMRGYWVYRVRAVGTGLTKVLAGEELDDAAWSPDGSRLVYSNSGSIWVARADGSQRRRLTHGSENPDIGDNEPAWSPDGRRISFGRDGDVWVMNSDGSDETRLTSDVGLAETEDGEPDWSPDGRWIAFERHAIVGCSCDNGIWIMGADGRNARQATEGDDSDPKWRSRATS
jgi:Tol biopolymer transport system component